MISSQRVDPCLTIHAFILHGLYHLIYQKRQQNISIHNFILLVFSFAKLIKQHFPYIFYKSYKIATTNAVILPQKVINIYELALLIYIAV